ncbi:MAG TPA: TolC family outer membrane protein [Gammaproteobacteria bacterium]|nr:TolC family outer membrane protein [Gammaproteobacteria bacterium]
MNKRIVSFVLITGLFSWSLPGFAVDLMQAFQQGLNYDPTFKAAEAQYLATYELIPITRGALLPQITATGYLARIHEDIDFLGNQKFYDTSTQYNISANQALFNYKDWALLQNARAQSKQAFASYNAALQDLMVRVANAYFSVLQAYDELLATEANKRSLAQQLHQTQEQYKVGLIAVTGVEQVRASYDLAIAQEIVNQNTVADKLEELRAITGVFYTRLAGIKINLPLVTPEPNDINEWVAVAVGQNYTLQSAFYAMIAAQQNVKVQRAGHFPVITGQASYAYDNESANPLGIGTGVGNTLVPQTTRLATIAVNATLPVFTGGTVTAQTNQAAWQYAEAAAQREQTYRNVATQTRESFLGVISGISKINADLQSIRSNESSLSSTKASYTVGTATIVDVLQQQFNLYSAQTQYAVDQYSYIISTLALKQAAGTLSINDMHLVNGWLGKPIDFTKFNFNAKPIQYASDTLPKTPAPPSNYNPDALGEPQQTPPAAIKYPGSDTTSTTTTGHTDYDYKGDEGTKSSSSSSVSTTHSNVNSNSDSNSNTTTPVANQKMSHKKKVEHSKLTHAHKHTQQYSAG